MTAHKDRVLGLVRSAFQGVTLGAGIGPHQGQGLDDYADERTLASNRARSVFMRRLDPYDRRHIRAGTIIATSPKTARRKSMKKADLRRLDSGWRSISWARGLFAPQRRQELARLGGVVRLRVCLIRAPFSRVLGTLIPETSFWDSLGRSYDRRPLVKALRQQWNVFRLPAPEAFVTSWRSSD